MSKVQKKDVVWDPGEANQKQKLFYLSRTTYTAYGGAKGGGKTHAVRIKAVGGAIANPGIKDPHHASDLPELEENHIRPIVKMVPPCAGLLQRHHPPDDLSQREHHQVRTLER